MSVTTEVVTHQQAESEEEEEDAANDEGGDGSETDSVFTSLVQCLFESSHFPSVPDMLAHCRETHGFDLISTQKELRLGILETVKLVNYVRQQVAMGKARDLDLSSASFLDDQYLKPVLEDDPLLYSLEDVMKFEWVEGRRGVDLQEAKDTALSPEEASAKIADLQQALRETQQTLKATQQRLELALDALRFDETLDEGPNSTSTRPTRSFRKLEQHYKSNYDGYHLHRIMLSDLVRTDAYKQFVFENKHLFKDKTVLDVGCGSCILSLFCADAGAKTVYAVDSSEMIGDAIKTVIRNKKQHIIKILPGKIEDITLPVAHVDIIISEWMGYCLLFENMLPSVLFARDRYLSPPSPSQPGGLMIPSRTILFIAPFSNLEYVKDQVQYWDNVSGYDMRATYDGVHQDVDIEHPQQPSHLLAPAVPFLNLDLHTARVQDLSFPAGHTFSFEIPESQRKHLDGFVVWFDTFFNPSRPSIPAAATLASEVPTPTQEADKGVDIGKPRHFTTGPHGPVTHWGQGVCLIDYRTDEEKDPLYEPTPPANREQGPATGYGSARDTIPKAIHGSISYTVPKDADNGIDIGIKWQISPSEDGSEEGADGGQNGARSQVWFLH